MPLYDSCWSQTGPVHRWPTSRTPSLHTWDASCRLDQPQVAGGSGAKRNGRRMKDIQRRVHRGRARLHDGPHGVARGVAGAEPGGGLLELCHPRSAAAPAPATAHLTRCLAKGAHGCRAAALPRSPTGATHYSTLCKKKRMSGMEQLHVTSVTARQKQLHVLTSPQLCTVQGIISTATATSVEQPVSR